MKYFLSISALLFVLIFISCGPSQEDLARVKLNKAKALLQNSDTTNALLQLDSIAQLYPKAMYVINAAKNLKNEVYLEELQRLEADLDSTNIVIAKLEKNFVKEKTEFDRYTQYVHKRQNFKRRWDKSYIKVYLNELGEIYLSSNYYGKKWLDHTGLRVYDGPDQAKTEKIPLGNINNHHSDFMEAKWEKVTYRKGKDNGVIEFIANNTRRRLKAVFLGKRYYYIILEDYDKKAVKDALDLSKAIKKKKQLEAEVKKIQNSLEVK
ncbi:hypothetical protein MNBD_BACTEROID01-2536 [hydrothermal vent metagenome]|uniref:Lipoprotein n=1 Tax=hydrothermal vent metagenome TaxID=652676 RepID=A0A3B0UIY0_9ZZZZ